MDTMPSPFIPPAPVPRNTPPSRLEIIRTVMRNPLELWGEPSYTMRWIHTKFFNERTLIVNDPGLIRHVLVDNVKNYRMAVVRQLILRPILRDGLLTAEGRSGSARARRWRRSSRRATPRASPGRCSRKAEALRGEVCRRAAMRDIASDMTELTYEILSQTLFSGEIVRATDDFSGDIDRLLSTMGRVDPLDLLKAPGWIPAAAADRRPARAGQVPRHRQRDDDAAQGEDGEGSGVGARGFPDAAPAAGEAGRPDARRDRGQHHHLHRRRPRDDGPRARLDALLPGQLAGGPAGRRAGDRRRARRAKAIR